MADSQANMVDNFAAGSKEKLVETIMKGIFDNRQKYFKREILKLWSVVPMPSNCVGFTYRCKSYKVPCTTTSVMHPKLVSLPKSYWAQMDIIIVDNKAYETDVDCMKHYLRTIMNKIKTIADIRLLLHPKLYKHIANALVRHIENSKVSLADHEVTIFRLHHLDAEANVTKLLLKDLLLNAN